MSFGAYKKRAKMGFEHADVDRKGTLTKHQYKLAMIAVFGCCPDEFEVNSVFRSRVKDEVSYEEFEHWVLRKCHTDGIISPVSLETLFALLDKNCAYISRCMYSFTLTNLFNHCEKTIIPPASGNGYLKLEDFCSLAKDVNMRTPTLVWQKVFKELDQNRKGYIECDEFICMLNHAKNVSNSY